MCLILENIKKTVKTGKQRNVGVKNRKGSLKIKGHI